VIRKTYYSFDYANNATADGVFAKMKNRNLLAPIATRVWKNNQLINGSITQYADFAAVGTDTFVNPAKIYSLETSAPLTTAQAGESVAFTSPYTTLLPNTYFIEKADYNFNGTTGKVIEQKLVNDINQALIWDNTLSVLLAKTDNANFTDVAFSSFETAETGNWTYGSSSVVSDATAPTGAHAYTLGTTAISKNGLVSSTPYLISWWQKSGASVTVTGGSQSNAFTGLTINGYTYHEVQVTGTTSISISGTGSVDEVRLYPVAAQMTTYTYDPVLRLVAQCTVNGTIGYYEYDSLHRLTDIKDQNGNIVKAFEYNYGRQSRTSQ
jgi:YD repeat-containing protein